MRLIRAAGASLLLCFFTAVSAVCGAQQVASSFSGAEWEKTVQAAIRRLFGDMDVTFFRD
jgi:hypothetical protein